MRIWKYQISAASEQTIRMPASAQVLSVQTQHGTPCIWAMVDPRAASVARKFLVIATGEEIEDQGEAFVFVGTFQMAEGSLVFHLFAGPSA